MVRRCTDVGPYCKPNDDATIAHIFANSSGAFMAASLPDASCGSVRCLHMAAKH